MFLSVYTYGEPPLELTFNPCNANIWRACPLQAEVPIEAAGFILVSPLDVAGIPDLTLTVPDFEGEIILGIFSNSTQTETGCFAAQITNGNTFDHQLEVGSTLAAFTTLALLSSLDTVAYFDTIPSTRTHYAHCCSLLVVFAVWHHVYYSGALAVDRPTALIAFWNNYAWTGGMINVRWMQHAADKFFGSSKASDSTIANLASTYNIDMIYKRRASRSATSVEGIVKQGTANLVTRGSDNIIEKEGIGDTGLAFSFRGRFINLGLPLPGDHFGFSGLLAKQNIPAVNAFLTALLFLFITVASILLAITTFSLVLLVMNRRKLARDDRLLKIVVLASILVGTVTSYLSMTRNQDTIRPKQWNTMCNRCLQHTEFKSHEISYPRRSCEIF
ncbi:uncharacterized protein M421DRAFT_4502 [Didymella exigua CBS 183.55]|uniref:ML-like domain-containing protein n=1 Tax=Didymella exigua CBS 183.55 TaxID=1150837 RepID=A0A6A5RLQ3_9PLEO|nr:uncharacterized protein M421DRAFT_4502 [Didymella exigua CBS 183.55]KAF1929355.1 hypothetical protein M421DRAFT_4502 [Didymella exigua CBS 183.55]